MPRLAVSLMLVLMVSLGHAAAIHVPGDQPTIQAAINVAAAGDSILVQPGTYPERPVSNKGLTILGLGGPGVTTIDGGGVESVFSIGKGADPFVLEGLRIIGGGEDINFGWPYPALSHGSIDLTIRNCHIESFYLYGAVVTDCTFLPKEGGLGNGNYAHGAALFERCLFESLSGTWGASGVAVSNDVTIRDCVFRDCGGSGFAPVVGYDQQWAMPVIESNLFVDCEGPCIGPAQWPPVRLPSSRISTGNGFVVIRSNTFVRNENGPLGPYPFGPFFPFLPGTFEANVVTGSEFGVWLPPLPYSLSCNNSWGNDSNWTGFPDPTGTNGNFSAPPLFCDPENDNFTVAANSPLLPTNNPCGVQIGAFGQGCGPVAVQEVTWGAVKARYRGGGR